MQHDKYYLFPGRYPGNIDRQVVPQAQVRKYGGAQPQLVRHGDHWDQPQGGHQQWGVPESWHDNQNVGYGQQGGQEAYQQRVNRGRDF